MSKIEKKKKGGVATVVENHLKDKVIKVTDGKEGDEYIVTRIEPTNPAINVINIYGEQEGRTSKEEVENSWWRLMADINDIDNRKEAMLLMGDLNRAIGNDELGIKGNKEKVSCGGELIKNLIGTKQYVLVNNLDIVEGGPWTFIDRQDGLRKSCLDLNIVSINLLPFITKVEVDNKRKFTPRRVMKRKDKIVTIFSDHFSTKVEMEGNPRVKNENPPGS